MNDELKLYLKDLAMNQLLQTKPGDKLGYAMKIFENVQQHLYAFASKEEESKQTQIKAVTVLTVSIMKKVSNGKMPTDLENDDWKEILNDVSKYAILQNEKKYVEYVFTLYEGYLRESANYISAFAPEKTVIAIQSLADELHDKSENLRNDEIAEITYIEDCMWISLEAIIKLLASMSSLLLPSDYADFTQALAMYAFEYGRYVLYSREQALINEFIHSQYELDAELEQKYARFIEDLEKQAEHFYVLIDNAFTPNFRESFLHSITLAQTVGVENTDILFSTDDIDAFFLD